LWVNVLLPALPLPASWAGDSNSYETMIMANQKRIKTKNY